jgi:O-antigen/teichoic acid export membrane protein
MLRAFLKDSAVYAVPAFISRGLSLFLLPLYTRVLSPADYGSLDLLLVFASIVNLTVALEITQGVARFYGSEPSADRRVEYASSAFWFTVACYTVFALIALLYSAPVSAFVMGREDRVVAFQIGVAYIWLNGIFYVIQGQFRWERRSKRYAAVSLLVTFCTAAVAVWLAYGLRLGLEGLLLGMLAGVGVGVVYGLCHLRRSFRLRFSRDRLKEMLIFSAPFVPSGIAVFISTYVDRMMINHFLSVGDVGLYGIGYRLANVVVLVMVGIRTALTPLVYAHYQEADTPRQLERIFRFFVAAALFGFAAITLFAIDILVLLTHPAFYGGAEVVIYLVPAILLAQMYIFAPGISIARKTHLILWVNVLGAIVNTALNWLLIPLMGLIGAALATMLGYLCVFSAYMILSQRFYHVPHQWGRIAVAALIAFLLAAIVPNLPLQDVSRWIVSLLSLAFLLGIIVSVGLLRPEELRRVGQVIRGQFTSLSRHPKG